MYKINRMMSAKGFCKDFLKICLIFVILLGYTSSSETALILRRCCNGIEFWYSLLPLQSYHIPPSSGDICSWVCNRWHSSSVVCRNRTGSFLTVHHSHLVSSDDRKKTLSNTFTSGPSINTTANKRQLKKSYFTQKS